jgi:hypothetical protein
MKLQLLPFPLIAQVCHRPWPSGKRLQPPIHETAIIIIEDQKEMIHIIKSLKHNNQNNINIQTKLHTIKKYTKYIIKKCLFPPEKCSIGVISVELKKYFF